ncbi:MAG TPA: hypothetical protein VFV99_03510 [Kofleriaceae bacterium]|nr:hypothetical protein [Kofleriaceae bacterium]
MSSVLADETEIEIDELWRRCAKGYGSSAERDPWLHASRTDHPGHHGLVYILRSTYHLDAVMIARHDPVESAIVNYCGPAQDRDLMAELGAHVIADLARRKTVRIRAATTHAPMMDALESIGFVHSRRPGAAVSARIVAYGP